MPRARNLVFFEFLGTTVILFGAFLGSLFIPDGGYNWITPPFVGLAIALTFHKSGAHLNPAVTALVNAIPRKHRIQNGLYGATQFATAALIGFALLPLLSRNGIAGAEFWEWRPQVVLLETLATFILMSLIAILAINGKAIWTIIAVPAMLYLLAVSPLSSNQMNPAVTLAQTIEGLLSPAELVEHFAGEALGVALVILWVRLWVVRKRPISQS
jgi:glycerol uptake facilitator-like aquaporin